MKGMSNKVKLVVSIALPQIVAAAGAYFTVTGTGSWYRAIKKPDWNPPSWVFGPTWTLLYILMGIAFYLVWTKRGQPADRKVAMIFWMVQLVLNFLWTVLFFYWHLIGWALVEIGLLWLAILLTIIAFVRVRTVAAVLLLPYLAWVTFAGVLTYTIWKLNS